MALGCSIASVAFMNLPQEAQGANRQALHFGNFSVSLAVKDIRKSKGFYEKLDFQQVAGDLAQNWVILQNGTTTVGLFQGMWEKNLLTFNPGWNHKQETLADFRDVRELQHALAKRGIELLTSADEKSTGPASFTMADPDGNLILVDQHVPKPKR
jgi:catechol 2,3-dioxygenase-like lactoylglutathione lyase family enzyme